MQQFNAPCFTSRQKLHHVKIDEHHLLKVYHDRSSAVFYLLG